MEDLRAVQSGTATERLLELSGSLTVGFACDLLTELSNALDGAERVRCDVTKVSEADLIGLQLLCSAHRTAMRDRKIFSASGVRDGAVGQLLDVAGFSRQAGCSREKDHPCLWTEGGA